MKLEQEEGVALMTVILLTAVLMVMCAGMFAVARREETMTAADFSGGQAFYYAEGGIENVLNILSYNVTEAKLTQLRTDQSEDGHGYLMDPNPANRQAPANPVEMLIGNERYTVWLDWIDEYGNHCTGCDLKVNDPSDRIAFLRVTAEGQSAQGYRKLQQQVRVVATNYPLSFYVNGDVTMNGGPTLVNQSIYVRGSFYGREKLTISGTDQIYGGPAGVFATGSIFAKSNAGRSQIYTSSGGHSSYWAANYVNDRDNRGPSGNKFTISNLESTFSASGLSSTHLAILKQQAKTSGYYNGNPSRNLTISQSDIPNHDGDVVIYVEYPSGNASNNEVSMKFKWPNSPYTSGKALIIIKNGSLKLTGSAIGNTQGVIYCPDGDVRADGSGGGTFTGYVWAKGMTNIGNFNFTLTPEFVIDPPFFAWEVTRETAWTDVDR